MSNVLTGLITTIESDLSAAWKASEVTVETEAAALEADGLVLWNDAKTIFTTLLPSQYTILWGLIAKVVVDVENNGADIAKIETALLNDASVAGVEELAWVTNLGSKLLQAFIAVFNLKSA